MVKKWERQKKKTNRDVVYEKRKQRGEKVNEHYYQRIVAGFPTGKYNH